MCHLLGVQMRMKKARQRDTYGKESVAEAA